MSLNSLQMLMVLEALVPCHLQKLKSNTVNMESASAARDEIAAIAALATSLQALLYSSETLTRLEFTHCVKTPPTSSRLLCQTVIKVT